MTDSLFDFYRYTELIERLATAPYKLNKNVVFMLGSALTAPHGENNIGVPSSSGIVKHIKNELVGCEGALAEIESAPSEKQAYQRAFKALFGNRGQDYANKIIFDAVCQARVNYDLLDRSTDDYFKEQTLINAMEGDIAGWYINPGLDALSKLITEHIDKFGRTVLTTNFDPLIEISIKRQAGIVRSTILSTDGTLEHSLGTGSHVVHLHGYWHGFDTLHTPRQLAQVRPNLKSSIQQLLSNSIVVVIGYSGWDDIFLHALTDMLTTGYARPDVLWCFNETESSKIRSKYSDLLKTLEPGINKERITLYNGIDCHKLLPLLLRRIQNASDKTKAESTQSSLVEDVDSPINNPFSSDSPPSTEDWVGREKELQAIESSSSRIVFITGIAGQGKSALASKYLGVYAKKTNEYSYWDWRDCREEGDKLRSQIIAIIERLTNGSITAKSLAQTDFKSVCSVFVNQVENKKCLFVFDNVDHYIDLAKLAPTGGLDVLISEIKKYQGESRFLFTCRPNVAVDSVDFYCLALEYGLSTEETTRLFSLKGVRDISSQQIEVIRELTRGHPLWLLLLAAQITQHGFTPDRIISTLNSETGNYPEQTFKTLKEMWVVLNESQKSVLRTMAEAVRPESEDTIYNFVTKSITWNKYQRAMRGLKSVSLIVIKPRDNTDPLLELHPLVKKFIKDIFPRSDREKYIVNIISYFSNKIHNFKQHLTQEPSYYILDHWLQKVELDVNKGDYGDALDTLWEVSGALLSKGYSEEFVRAAKLIYMGLNWGEAFNALGHFNDIFSKYIETLTQLGRYDDAEKELERYKDVIPGKSVEYINFCNLKCYLYWYKKEFDAAIHWGERGDDLKIRTKPDTNYDCAHNLALARRDSGRQKEAIEYFRGSEQIEDIVKPGVLNDARPPHFYGNVGRCLQFMGKLDQALECYRKSLSLLLNTSDAQRLLNEGYARYWIGQTLAKMRKDKDAFIFLLTAESRWKKISPPRATEVRGFIESLDMAEKEKGEILSWEEWQLDNWTQKWLSSSS